MSLKLNESLRPPGGYRFVDADRVTHEANDLAGLVKAVTRYRAATGRPPGNPLEEVTEAICRRAPKFCTGAPDVPPHDAKALAVYVANDIRRAMLHPLTESVELNEARTRMTICMTCPGRVNWTEGCAPCQRSVAGGVEIALAGREVFSGAKDKACLGAGDCLSLALWRKNPRTIARLPDNIPCWRKERKA